MADVGDFGKYGILRALCREKPRISLGVVWYLFPNEPCGNDGRHVGYLEGCATAELSAWLQVLSRL